MTPLHSAAGRAALARLRSAHTLFAFDFDGTLAPIVIARGSAAMPAGVYESLRALAAIAPVAVISGRALADLTPRLPDGILAVGNHGIEGAHAPPHAAALARTVCRNWLRQLEHMAPLGPIAVDLDDKSCSLSLHGEPARLAASRTVVAALDPAPVLVAGKDVLNVVPPGMPDKGDALAALIAGTGATNALYVGDDGNDEPAFARGSDRILTVRIGKAESSAASHWLDDSAAVGQLINSLLQPSGQWRQSTGRMT